jgi:hypothetical protein
MDQPTATIIASLGSSVVGVAALASAAWQSNRTMQHQRQMASDQRLAERRAELYVELLELTLYTGQRPRREQVWRREEPRIDRRSNA